MFEGLGFEDQRMMFNNCIVLIKNKLVFVHQVGVVKWLVSTLRDSKEHWVENPLAHISPPYARLGMVNLPSGAVFLSRVPQRQYQVGYSNNNVRSDGLPLRYNNGAAALRLDSRPVYDCLKNSYPSLEEAIEQSALKEAPVAFDKQFAVDSRGDVAFKKKKVGKIVNGEIQFTPPFEYLSLLLGDINEKDLRNPK